jgi:ACR3 family arsenite transporter
MVFVWSHHKGDAAYTLVQVSLMASLCWCSCPHRAVPRDGASSLAVPFHVLLYSVLVFIVMPLAVGTLLRWVLVDRRGKPWFENTLLPKFSSVTVAALLATLVLIFAFQADNITSRFFHVALLAVPITCRLLQCRPDLWPDEV